MAIKDPLVETSVQIADQLGQYKEKKKLLDERLQILLEDKDQIKQCMDLLRREVGKV